MLTGVKDVQPLAEADKAALRSQLVPAMLALSNPADKAVRAQIAESVALIAELDFPDKWTDLIDVRPQWHKPINPANTSFSLSATRRITFAHRLQRQCWSPRDSPLYFQAMESPSPIRQALQRDQPRPLEICCPFPPTLQTDGRSSHTTRIRTLPYSTSFQLCFGRTGDGPTH